jgi:hypothetical protein
LTNGENVVTLCTDVVAKFVITGFPGSGWSLWPYRVGETPDGEELAYVNIKNPTHCGLTAGCIQASNINIKYDGKSMVAQKEVYDKPFNLKLTAAKVTTVDWLTVAPAFAWSTVMNNLSQPVSMIKLETADGVLRLGVTASKDHLLFVPAGVQILLPDGEMATTDKPTALILTNTIADSDTVVFQVAGLKNPVQHMEFRPGFESSKAGEFIARYSLTKSASFGFNGATSVDLMVLSNTADSSVMAVAVTNYNQPLK